MNISVIIPTCDRSRDLKKCLELLEKQKKLPFEVIVVDQSDDKLKSKQVSSSFHAFFCLYFWLEAKSASLARNTGLGRARGDIFLFLDDDVRLEEDYLLNLERFFENNKNALGVTGKEMSAKAKTGFLKKISGFLTFLDSFSLDSFVVRRSGFNSYPSIYPDFKKEAMWLPGNNMALKKEVFKENKFDERLKKWSIGEDLYLTFGIYQEFPRSLWYSPDLKLTHHQSKENRPPEKEKILMLVFYKYLFFTKYFRKRVFNRLAFLIALFADIVLGARESSNTVDFLKKSFMALLLLLKKAKLVREGKVDVNSLIYE